MLPENENLLKKWSKIKIKIELQEQPRFCKAGDVWWCVLGQNIGTEQHGSGNKFQRPIVILKIFNHKTILIAPMTTSSSSNKYRINIGQIKDKDSIVLINQIKTISTKRLTEKITILEDELFRQIKKKIRKFF